MVSMHSYRLTPVAPIARMAFAIALGLLTFATGAGAATPVTRPAPAEWGAHRVRALDLAGLDRTDRAMLRALPATARVARHPTTGRVRFLGGTHTHPLADSIDGLLDRTAGLFGVRDPRVQLRRT